MEPQPEKKRESNIPDTSAPKKQPLLTLPAFLISFVIIAVVFGFFSAIFDSWEPEETETRLSTDGEYEYIVVEGDSSLETSFLKIPVSGVILTEAAGDLGFFEFLGEGGVTYGYDVAKQLERASLDDSIAGIILEINSPGGTIGGARAIADGVEDYKEYTGKPVVAHIIDTGASGGYWAAISADRVIANYGSTVGSIGVIMGPFVQYNDVVAEGGLFGGVETENGIDYRYFSAGRYKDTGNPYRDMTPEEERHWQTSLDNEYEQFVSYVSTRRNISPDTIRNQITALPYETTRALQLNMIDAIGDKDYAMDYLADLADVDQGDYNVIVEQPFLGFFDSLFGVWSSMPGMKAHQATSSPRVCDWCNKPMYLYDGGFDMFSK